MQNIYKLLIGFAATVIIFGCEDAIELDSGFEGGQVVVDAWLTNENSLQTITLTESQDYFDNRLPTAVSSASVTVTSDGEIYTFEETTNGAYIWTPAPGQTLGTTGSNYDLEVIVGETVFTSSTTQKRVPAIDSISIFVEDEAFGATEGLYAEVYARDLPGQGDTYWVKSFRNDTLLARPQELNIVYDGTFGSGSVIDGIYFLRPLRFAINALDDDGAPRALNTGDEVKVEIHSISNDGFRFLETVLAQTTNGDATIFALPVANALGNVINTSTGDRALGFFNVAGVSRLSRTVE